MQALYLHFPFCRQACIHCDYPFRLQSSRQSKLVECLCQEIDLRADHLPHQKLESVYIGGGTPSLLRAQELETVFGKIQQYFDGLGEAEITMEANPEDVTSDYIRFLNQHTPVNRLSLGIQSFAKADLEWLNRPHTVSDNRQALEIILASSLSNLSIDLIYGLPTQNEQQWAETIQTAFQHDITHLTAYGLTISAGTPLGRQYDRDETELPSSQSVNCQFNELRQNCRQQGWGHYELTNFCQPDAQSRQNLIYWFAHPYLGVGPGAHSYLQTSEGEHCRQWNTSEVSDYIETIQNEEIPAQREFLSPHDRLNEWIMNRITTQRGLSLKEVQKEFGEKLSNILQQSVTPYKKSGQIEQSENKVKLTKKGQAEADQIIADLFIEH